MHYVNLSGRRFGRWVVLKYATANHHRSGSWLCRCDCGTIRGVREDALLRETSQSCGCVRYEKWRSSATKHGEAVIKTKEYCAWQSVVQRCTNPTCNSYYKYGGRGIQVCERWRHSFPAFLEDMGRKPSPTHSLERIDNNGHYELSNCRWATREAQANNKRSSRRVTCDGRTMTVAQWSRELGIKSNTIIQRLNCGWPAEEALTRPVQKTGRLQRVAAQFAPKEVIEAALGVPAEQLLREQAA